MPQQMASTVALLLLPGPTWDFCTGKIANKYSFPQRDPGVQKAEATMLAPLLFWETQNWAVSSHCTNTVHNTSDILPLYFCQC